MKSSKLMFLTAMIIAIGFGAMLVIMAIFPDAAKVPDSGMMRALCLISLAGAGCAFLLIEWHNLGRPASWHWLKWNTTYNVLWNTTYNVLARIDDGKKTYLVIEHRGEPRMFRFDVRLSEDIRAGSTFVIQKNFGSPETGRGAGDGLHILNVIQPLQACL